MTPIHHPRPQLRRDPWISLNGEWQFLFDDQNQGRRESWELSAPWDRTIRVPFTYETEASGIGEAEFHPVVWYRREFQTDADQSGKRLLLHFEGVDNRADVWINGRYAGSHRGGYSRFSLDITDLVEREGVNSLVLRGEDSLDMEQPRGKQRWMKDSYACWYVQNTGIWKSVWMEYTGSSYLKGIKMTPHVDTREVVLEYDLALYDPGIRVRTEISFGGRRVNLCEFTPQREYYKHTLSVEDEQTPFKVHLWFPKGMAHFEETSPALYDLHVTLLKDNQGIDSCRSYFGMRKISIEKGQVLLNNAPLYQKLILDQGYWSESAVTPPDEKALIKDLEIITAAGYNGVRKHQKTEDERFLYHCDHEGILVWGEVGAGYRFNDRAQNEFARQWDEIVDQFYNHPSIITWVPFNESWGVPDIGVSKEQQNFVNAVYFRTKAKDPMRPVICNDGWEHTISDIITIHDYVESGEELSHRFEHQEDLLKGINAANGVKRIFAAGYDYSQQPILISEFGGIAFAGEGGWGYGNPVRTKEEFLQRFEKICRAIRHIPYVCGYCYTQLSDVEQEINGIVTADRREKVPLEEIRRINGSE